MPQFLQRFLQPFLKIKPSIQIKLMVIISSIVLVSLGVLTLSNLTVFQNTMSGMVTIFNSESTKLLAEKVDSEINRRLQNLRLLYHLKQSGTVYRERSMLNNAFFSEKDDSLFLFLISQSSLDNSSDTSLDNEFEIYTDEHLQKEKISAAAIKTALLKSKETIAKSLNGETQVINLSRYLPKACWLLLAKIDPENNIVAGGVYATEKLASIFLGENKLLSSFMVESPGNIVIHPDEKKIMSHQDMTSNPIVTDLFHAKVKHAMTSYDFQGQARLGAFQRLESAGNLGVVSSVSEEDAFSEVRWARINAVLISLIIIVLAILFVYYFAKSLSEPIKKLVDASQQIAEGNYELNLKAKTRDEIGELTSAFNSMSKGLAEREKLKGAFGKFVNKEIARQVMEGELKLGGEQKEVTVFFSDIRSFTSMSDPLSPTEIVNFLNEYISIMVKIINQTDGVVDKFIGDAIMAVWGAPLVTENDAVNSVEAAMLMREALLVFNKDRGTKERPIIHIGCGINTGQVLAGQIGSEDKLEYTVIGDAVNLASRIEHLCKGAGLDILISESTYQLVKNIYACKNIGKVKIRGKVEPQLVFAVLGRKNDPNRPQTLSELRKLMGIQLIKKGKKIIPYYAILKK